MPSSFIVFVSFCCAASAIYIVNDLADLTHDRQHPTKRMRPFARGAVPIEVGLAAVPFLLVASLMLASIVNAAYIIVIYAAISIIYSSSLKAYPLLDIFVLTFLYMCRLFGGGEATAHNVSLWLFAYAGFLFLSLALLKRVGELQSSANDADVRISGRGYRPADLNLLLIMGVSSLFTSCLVLALYLQYEFSSQAKGNYSWGIVPLMLLWQCRLWLATTRGEMNDDRSYTPRAMFIPG